MNNRSILRLILVRLIRYRAPTSIAPWKRWMNLWVVIRPDSEDEYPESEEDNDIGEEEFVGNIVLSLCIGFLILVHHLVVVSAIEACWLQKMKVQYVTAGP